MENVADPAALLGPWSLYDTGAGVGTAAREAEEKLMGDIDFAVKNDAASRYIALSCVTFLSQCALLSP